jgi:hypothetical protein
MSKFDKKVLKFVAARQEDDLDVDDIAIGLRLDEDDVREALDSLQDQGKVEGSPRNGKTYWRLSIPGNGPVEDVKQTSDQNTPDVVAIDFDQAIAKQQVESLPVPEEPLKMEPADVEKETVLPQKHSVPDIDDAEDDTDMNFSPKTGNPQVAWIAIAIAVSVVISAVVSLIIAGGPQKGYSDSLRALERKSTESNAKLDMRITEINALVNVLNDKLSARQQPKTDPGRAAKASHPQRKKQAAKKQSPTDENAASEPSGSDQGQPPASSGQDNNSGAAPTPPSSTEGTGESGQ